MTDFKSRSQAGQDIFAWVASGRKTDGTFLDVGSGHACVNSNTVALEHVGWTGSLFDITDYAEGSAIQLRKSKFYRLDATTINWPVIVGDTKWIDYLSLDVDPVTLSALENIPHHLIRFGAITIEHDAYRFGDIQRTPMRDILSKLGYVLIASDVRDQELEFEDWWVDERYEENASIFKSKSSEWRDIVPCI